MTINMTAIIITIIVCTTLVILAMVGGRKDK